MFQLGQNNRITECGLETPPFIVTMEILNIMVMFTSVLLK
jgi:hypothetical protein